jgi:hypothetical protein
MFGIPELFVLAVLAIPVAIGILCFALYDLTQRRFPDGSTKVVWALIILFVPILGPLLYVGVGKRQGER